jgi:cytoskeletal protein RodZ
MIPDDLLNKFQVCQEELENGSSLETVLRLYPQDAPRLRPLLETAQALSSLRPGLAEANAARAEVWRRIEDRLPYRQAQMRRQRQRLLWASAASLLIISAAIFVSFSQAPREDVAAPIAATLTAQTTAEATEEMTSEATEEATHTPSPTTSATRTPTPTRTPSPTTSATRTPTPTRTPSTTISATLIPRPTIGTGDEPLPPEEHNISDDPSPVAEDNAGDDDSLPVQEDDTSDDDHDGNDGDDDDDD